MKRSYLIISLIFAIIITSGTAYCQENKSIREIGIRSGDLRDIDFIYKKQLKDLVFSRTRILSANLNIAKFSDFNGSFSLGVGVGREKRNPITDKLFFVTGGEFIGSLSTTYANDKLKFTLTPGIGVILGFSYLLKDNFIIGIETIPMAFI